MTTDDIHIDLYGVSSGVIAVIMGFFTLLTPYGAVPGWWVLGDASIFHEPNIVYSLFWVFGLHARNMGFHNFVVYNPALLWTTLPLSLPNVIFAVRVVRYYQNQASKDSVLRWAIAAFIVPFLILCIEVYMILKILYETGTFLFTYFGPIPIQIGVGLFIMFRIRAPELVTPWTDPEIDESWWIEEEIEESCVGELFITMEELDEIYKIWD
ncbi:MAG: hypothetical protein ACW974_10290 [Candidatus Thorarchaeota archaeon]|jgi:hypothetical protein